MKNKFLPIIEKKFKKPTKNLYGETIYYFDEEKDIESKSITNVQNKSGSKYTTFISGTLLQSFLSYVEVLPLLLIGVATKAISCPCVGSKGWEDLIGDGTVALLSNVVDLFTTD